MIGPSGVGLGQRIKDSLPVCEPEGEKNYQSPIAESAQAHPHSIPAGGDIVKEGVKVTNIMADGSICEDLSTYLDNHELPEDAKSLIVDFIRAGRKIREAQGG